MECSGNRRSDRPHKGSKAETGGEAQFSESRCMSKSQSLRGEEHNDDAQIFDLDASDDLRDINDVNVQIGKEMAALSREDREQVYYDLHGVSGEVQETAKLIEDSLRDFQIALDNIEEKNGYEEAMRIDKSFVEDSDFRLRFLRADRFDVSEAAGRYVRHFDLKLELFGIDLLCRHIEQDDLDPDDLESLYDGSMFPLPSRDSAGRHITCVIAQTETYSKAVRRRVFYVGMVRSEDELNLKKGMVGVCFGIGTKLQLDGMAQRRKTIKEVARITKAVPARLEALHFCTDRIFFRALFSIFRMAAAVFSRLRTREHFGSLQEVLFSLQTYGIPTYHFPIAEDGTIDKELANSVWVKRRNLERRRREEAKKMVRNENASMLKSIVLLGRVVTPGNDDILMGRGKSAYTHVGNIRFRNLISERFPIYEQSAYMQRSAINQTVLGEVKRRSGRFLKDDGTEWVEVEDKVALKKVSHAFRTFRALQSDSAPDLSNSQGADKRSKRTRSEEDP